MRAILIPLLCIAAGAAGGEKGPNLKVLQGLGREIGEEIRAAIGPVLVARPSFRISPEESGIYLHQDIAAAFADLPTTLPDSASLLEIGIVDARVAYEDVRRDGLFGARVMDRIVTLGIRMRWTSGGGEPILREFTRSSRDTVDVDERESLEIAGVPMTRGTLPPQGVWQNLLEPILLVGSIGVAIVLLFTIRS